VPYQGKRKLAHAHLLARPVVERAGGGCQARAINTAWSNRCTGMDPQLRNLRSWLDSFQSGPEARRGAVAQAAGTVIGD